MKRLMISLFVTAALATAFDVTDAQAQADKPNCFVLAIGVDRYQNPRSNLRGCVSDARNLAQRFAEQQSKLFGKVHTDVRVDGQATKKNVIHGLEMLRRSGKAGDWVVFVFSGHGGYTRHQWSFVPHDHKSISQESLLYLADDLATQGKKAIIIVDACHSGHLRFAARDVLNRHSDSTKGGVILMVSSMPGQLSTALGRYSAFAQAVNEGLQGQADFNRDRQVTLKELRRFAYHRVYELQLENNRRGFGIAPRMGQDSAIDASLSISENQPLASVAKSGVLAQTQFAGYRSARGSAESGYWTMSSQIVLRGKTYQQAYKLRLRPDGTYTAHNSLYYGGRRVSAGSSTGVYLRPCKSGELILVHKWGRDRATIPSRRNGAMTLQFGKSTYRLVNMAVQQATGELTKNDGRDSLRMNCFHDVHTIRLVKGKRYVIELSSRQFDTWLRLEDANGRKIKSDDDSGGNRNSRIVFTSSATGTYRLIATSYSAQAIGDYDLLVRKEA